MASRYYELASRYYEFVSRYFENLFFPFLENALKGFRSLRRNSSLLGTATAELDIEGVKLRIIICLKILKNFCRKNFSLLINVIEKLVEHDIQYE